MDRKNRGFTLIELIIAIAVLSTMTAVLFQAFVVSRRIDTKARKEERVQNLARSVMEDLKGYPFEKLEKEPENPEGPEPEDKIILNGITYTYKPLTSPEGAEGYLLESAYKLSPESDAKAAYLIKAEVDFGRYKKVPEDGKLDTAYTINNYEMPNIADVSSFQNVVLSPDMLIKDDTLQMGELLLKVNEEEESAAAEEAENGEDYTEDSIRKVLQIELKELKGADIGEDAGKLILNAKGIYSVEEISGGVKPVYNLDLSVDFPIGTFKKQIELDGKTKKPLNRIYLFLSERAAYEKIYITAETPLEEIYELFVIAADAEAGAGHSFGQDDIIIEDVKDKVIRYTNLESNKPVSFYPAENRVYRLKVTVYEAEYESEGSDPVQGKELLTLDSTKSE